MSKPGDDVKPGVQASSLVSNGVGTGLAQAAPAVSAPAPAPNQPAAPTTPPVNASIAQPKQQQQQQQRPRQQHLSFSDTRINAKIKAPKLVVGPIEVGCKLTYNLADLGAAGQLPLLSKQRIGATVSFKDIFIRGKLELDPRHKRVEYSKKLRVPYLNTGVLKLHVSADWSSSRGVLGNVLGLRLDFKPESLLSHTLVRKAPDYSVHLQPRIGAPQALLSAVRFPGSLYCKADTTLHLADSPRFTGVRGKLDVHELNLVAKLYDTNKVKPSRFERRLAKLAWEPLAEASASAASGSGSARAGREGRRGPAVKVVGLEEQEEDIIDLAAEKAREWAHAVLVNTCVATNNLQAHAEVWADQAGSAAQGALAKFMDAVQQKQSGGAAAVSSSAPAAKR